MASESALFDLFEQAASIPDSGARSAYLEHACMGDAELRRQVEALLADADNITDDFLETPALVQAPELDISAGLNAARDKLALPPGSAVGPYRLVKLIGEGGMGRVYLAEQDQPVRRRVALKIVKPGMGSATILARFETERQVLASMDHPNIARVFDAGTTRDGVPYFVMELVVGEPLTAYCDTHALNVTERIRLFGLVCAAIQHAHQNGIIHRDIKPTNILVHEVDGAPVPKVIDFGIAKAFAGKAAERSMMTVAGAIFGTLEYMSPEQADGGSANIDTRSDVYSLGVLMYELLTGTTPLDRGLLQKAALLEALRMIREDDPVRPSERVAGSKDTALIARNRASAPTHLTRLVRGELDWIVMRALEKDRTRRYESPAAMARDLQDFLDDKPVSACPPSQTYLLRKWVRRHRGLFGAACLIMLALALGAAGIFSQWRSAEAARATAEHNATAAAAATLEATAAKARAETSAESERRGAYADTLAAALAARERHDLGQARKLLDHIAPELRGFDWRLLRKFCDGDELQTRAAGDCDEHAPQTIGFHPDGKRLAIITAGGMLHVHDSDGNESLPPRNLPSYIPPDAAALEVFRGLTYSPDGKRIAYTNSNELLIVNADTLQPIDRFDVTRPQFGWLDNDRLLVGHDISLYTTRYPAAWIINLADRTKTALPGALAAPLCLSGDRKVVALTQDRGGTKRICLFHAEMILSAVPFAYYRPQGGRNAQLMALSETGDYLALATGTVFERARFAVVVQTATENRIFTQEYRTPINDLAIQPNGKWLAIAQDDAIVRLLDFSISQSAGTHAFDDGVEPALCELYGSDGPHDPPSVLGSRSAEKGQYVFLYGHERRIATLTFSTDGGQLFTAGADGTVRTWTVGVPKGTGRIERIETEYFGRFPAASADGRHILALQAKDNLFFYEPDKPPVACPEGHHPLAVLSDGRFATMKRETGEVFLFSAALGKAAEHWHIPGPAIIGTFSAIRRGVLTRNEQYIVGAVPGKLFVVDLKNRTTVTTNDLRQRMGSLSVSDHAVSPDGRWIAATGFGPRTRIFQCPDPRVEFTILGAERNYDTGVAFSPNGDRLYVGNEDGRVRVFETGTWKELADLSWTAHQAAVTALAISNDGSLVATSGDNTLKLWRAEPAAGDPRHELLSFRAYYSANWIHFAADSHGKDRALLFSAPRRTLEIWEAK